MSYYKFRPNDLFVNTLEANPDVKFYIQSGSIYIDDRAYISGTYSDNIETVPRNYINLFGVNTNRNTGSLHPWIIPDTLLTSSARCIYPFVIKDGNRTSFKSITKTNWNTQFNFGGNEITSSYNLSASITRYLVSASTTSYKRLRALTNVTTHYKYLSPRYDFSTYYQNATTNLISIPSIFYGSSIKKGTVNLKYYISGALAAQASDYRYNGELIQVSGSPHLQDQIVGTILYNEGIILLTSSAEVDSTTINYETAATSSWIRFGFGSNDGGFPNDELTSVQQLTKLLPSYSIEFQGVNHIQTMTLLAKAPYAQLNNSNNPTYLDISAGSLGSVNSGSYIFEENKRILKNMVSSSFTDVVPPMAKETYISTIGLYDKDKNLIGYAKLATPVLKTEDREFIFKLKLDL